MAGMDVSIVLTLHHEARYVRRTLMALSEAAVLARSEGITVELVTVLDRADAATRAALQATGRSAFDDVHVIAVDNGSPGPSRNDGCAVASGKYVTLADGDDLMGCTLIARTFAAAEARGPRVVFVPKFVFGFGDSYFTVEYFDQSDVSPLATLKHPLYSTRIFAHRSLFVENQFADVPVSSGYAYEDWHFNCNAVALGWRFAAVEGTAWFYRQRPGSQMQESDRISARQIPPSRLFAPATFLRLFAGEVGAHPPAMPRTEPPTRGVKVLEEPAYREMIRRINAIDPAVELGRYYWNCLGHFSNLMDVAPGVAYYHACEIVGSAEFDAVFLVSHEANQDLFIHQMHGFAAAHPLAAILVLLDGPESGDADVAPYPINAIVVDLAWWCRSLALEDRDLIALKLLQSCTASASVHCSPSDFSCRFFSRFGGLLQDRPVTCYRPQDRNSDTSGIAFADPSTFEFISRHLNVLDRIVWFDEETMERDWHRLPELREKAELRLPPVAPAA